ncbi:MAG TPA: RcnB family protein [Sphingobium sp.]|nr:RcnB family protein [Sphingobium sp.]
MRILGIILAGTGATLCFAAPLLAAAPSSTGARVAWGKGMVGSHPGAVTTAHRWGPRFQGRWFAGWRAPGGWAGYRPLVVGHVLPSYWSVPGYRIGNYGAYGLPAPAEGYGWSRYYDDAVLTDRDGRVRDHRSGIDWDRDDRAAPPPGVDYDDDVTAPDSPAPPHEYEGRWTGTWRDETGRAYSGEYEGRFEGEARSNYGVDYDAPPYAGSPHVAHHGGHGEPVVTTTHAPGYFAGGYYYPGATTTTVVIQPAVTTTTSYETVSGRRHGGRYKVRRNCNCK